MLTVVGFLLAGRPELAGKNYRRLNRLLLRLGICRVFAGPGMSARVGSARGCVVHGIHVYGQL